MMVNKAITIDKISGSRIIPYLKWFEDVPKRKQVDSEPIGTIIIKTLSKQYHGLLGSVNGKPVGILIYQMVGQHKIIFKFLYCRSYMARFYRELMTFLSEREITSFEFESIHKPELWDRMYPGAIKALRTTYTFDLARITQGGM